MHQLESVLIGAAAAHHSVDLNKKGLEIYKMKYLEIRIQIAKKIVHCGNWCASNSQRANFHPLIHFMLQLNVRTRMR